MRAIEALVREAAHRRMSRAGFGEVRPAHLKVMAILSRGGLRQKELAAALGVTPQAAGQLIDHLERLGFVERVLDPSDRRAQIVQPTRASERGYEVGRRIIRDWEGALDRRLGPRRAAQLRRTLAEIEEWLRAGGWE
jgi:DNA-binding MarR family transcriptional regulator